jgi:hypothetical protein
VSLVSVKATRHPAVLATYHGRIAHHVQQLLVTFSNDRSRAWLTARGKCKQQFGSFRSPLVEPGERPLCPRCFPD